MADPITPQTPLPTFSLNLEPATAPVQETVSPVIPTLNIQAATVETAPVEQIHIETTAPTAATENIQNPNEIVSEEVIQNPNTATNEPVQITEENNQTPPTDDRLQKEDELAQQQITIKEESPLEESPKIEKTSPEIKLPSTDFQKDLQIIQNLQQTPTNTPVQTSEIQKPIETVAPTLAPRPLATNSLNLDSLAVTIPSIPVAQTSSMPTTGNIPTAPQIPLNPYDHMQNYIPQIAPTAQIGNKTQGKGGIIGIAVGIVFILLTWFVIKTMYPLQYKSIVAGIIGTDEESIATEITNSMDSSGTFDSEFNSGEINFGSGDIILEDGLIDTGILESLTGGIHNIAQETTNTEPSIMTPSISPEEFKIKLEEYSKQGKAKLVEAKKSGNKELIQESLALYKKADSYLQDIANGKEMTSIDMETIINELSGYLNTLNPTTDAEVSNETPDKPEPVTPINTGGSDFNPEEFFQE